MNALWKLSPAYVPPAVARRDDLTVTREQILQSMLLIALALGLPALVAIAFATAGNNLLIGIYSALYLLVCLLTIFRQMPYAVRAGFVLLAVYGMSIAELFDSGQLGEVRMYLLVWIAITAVFFNYRAVIAAILLGTLTIVGAGLVGQSSLLAAFPALANLQHGTDWVTSSIASLMVNSMVAGAISTIVTVLGRNLRRQTDLSRGLEAERRSLEQRVQDRTTNLNRRNNQLRTAAEISRSISGLTDTNQLLQNIVNLLKDRYKLYYVGIFLIDTERKNAVLHAATGEAGQKMLEANHRLAIGGNSMIGWSIANRQARIAQEAREEGVRYNNPYLPGTRSEMALPVIAADEVLGALTIQSDRSNAFDEEDILILQGVADSLAVALVNARLYEQTRQSLEEIRTLNREYIQLAWADTRASYGALQYEYNNPMARASGSENNSVEIPILLRDEVIGHMLLELDRPQLDQQETSFVENVTIQTAIALENARLLYEADQHALQEQKMNQLASGFSRAMTIDEILRVAAHEFGQLATVREVSVQIQPFGTPERLQQEDGTHNAASQYLGENGKNGKERAA